MVWRNNGEIHCGKHFHGPKRLNIYQIFKLSDSTPSSSLSFTILSELITFFAKQTFNKFNQIEDNK